MALVACAVGTLVAPPALAAQAALSVSAPGGVSVTFTAAQLGALPRDSAQGTAHGRSARYHGVSLATLLAAARVTPIDSLRGRALRRVVVASAADGYVAVFSAAELDRSLGARAILVADRENGAALPAGDGPLRLVVPTDGRPARWVRQLVALTIVEVSP